MNQGPNVSANVSGGGGPLILTRLLLQMPLRKEEDAYFVDYSPPARDAITLPRNMVYVLVGVVLVVVATYAIVGHLIKDLVHDLAGNPDLLTGGHFPLVWCLCLQHLLFYPRPRFTCVLPFLFLSPFCDRVVSDLPNSCTQTNRIPIAVDWMEAVARMQRLLSVRAKLFSQDGMLLYTFYLHGKSENKDKPGFSPELTQNCREKRKLIIIKKRTC